MFRYWLRLLLCLTMLCVLPVLLIRAQPYDDHEVRRLLVAPRDCTAPCLMGIRPGVTTAKEVMAVLQTHTWVGAIDTRYYDPDRVERNLLAWRWSGQQPAIIDASQAGSIELAEWEQSGVQKVASMSIATHVTFGEFVLAAGSPKTSWFSYDAMGVFHDLNMHAAAFSQPAFQVSTRVRCPLSVGNLVNQPILRFSFGLPDAYADQFSIGRPSEYFAQYFLKGPFPNYPQRQLSQFPGC